MGLRDPAGVRPFRVGNVAKFEDVVGRGTGVSWELGELIVDA